ncbi:polysaccharide deacetylase family protein [Microbispora triticiradicis]|uniref:Polysaccharide deacetylase family protein n=1 Tax=Microbispora triticiradicis TaxID=2200763 RepID=A0ABX9LJX3_9ACTN|nr:polysaccharide deacetylase family protein [Microbispora triticiradicis]RGA04205.1 polysaccharide deacetylase family protein [Microbispora triticiradicis]
MWRKVRIAMAGVCVAGVCAVPTSAASAPLAVKTVAAVQTVKAVKPYCARYKCIALTFDDGPWPYTPALLDTLKKHKAKATFFLLGRKVANRPELTQRIVREGHEIGNHTWNHPDLTKLPDEEVLSELTSTSDVIYETIGRKPEIMRPPNGATNARISGLTAQLGLPQILWTGSTLDWQARNTKVIAARTLKLAKRDGVILLHDIVPETVKAMPGVLSKLEKQHYKFVTLTTLLQGRTLRGGEIYPPRGK